MLLDSNILINGASGEHPQLDEILARTDLAAASDRNMGLADAIIAATALVHGLKLVTRNDADFRHIAGLEIVNPFAPV